MKLKVTPPALVYAVTVLPRGIFKNSHYAVLIQTRIDFIPMCHPRDVGSQKLISSLTQNFNMSIQNEIDESKFDCWKLSYGVLWPEIVSCIGYKRKVEFLIQCVASYKYDASICQTNWKFQNHALIHSMRDIYTSTNFMYPVHNTFLHNRHHHHHIVSFKL